jgi:hypothetical protein
MKELPKLIEFSFPHTHISMVSGWRGAMGNVNLYMAINIHLWRSLKRNVPGLSVLWYTSDITGHFTLSPETQHYWHFEINYTLLQIFTREEARNV